ncbi:hypothetical protein EF919_18280 [Streptomyces sp. WAC02707]|uniref:hypothetical protein n=1 Tax=Streptomyces sp. WAC02707 TaxID=2487417 RepID=UPI000F79C9C9|nr:hypothetical protein [Streptomyces sp. WAC02707]RSS92482.1 hypothetical protein EF919_18280 [Streptomyces sp. WAC02707]
MTPADELRTAAQTLMDLADTAQADLDTDEFWKCYAPATAWRDGFVNGFGGVSSDLVAVFTPTTAHALAGWLRFEADLIDRVPGAELKDRTTHALNVARQINGSAP